MDDDELLSRATKAAEKLQQRIGVGEGKRSHTEVGDDVAPGEFDLVVLECAGQQPEWALRVVPTASTAAPPTGTMASPHPPFISELVKQVPAVAQAVARGLTFELIGPGPVLRGLRDGSLELIPATSGGLLGGVRKVGEKKILHQARFRSQSLTSTIGPQLVLSLVTAAVGAAHLAEIHRQLARVNERLDRVLATLQAERHGELVGSVRTLQEVAQQHADVGTFSRTMHQRLLMTEPGLRKVRDQLREMNRTSAEVRVAGADLARLTDRLGAQRSTELHDARLTVIAEAALVEFERLLLAYELEHDPENAARRQVNTQAARARIEQLTSELAFLSTSNSDSRLRLGELGNSPVRAATKGDALRTVRARLDDDQREVSAVMAAVGQLGTRAEPRHAPQVVRVLPRGASLEVTVSRFDIEPPTTPPG